MFLLKWIILLCLTLACYFVPPAPTVSVVMPVYNREKLVARAIDSILAQTFEDFEFIIVDDGSTDSTPNILKDYAARDKRVRILTHSKNKGIAHARNTGLFAARGKYIAPMDSDDYSRPNRLAKTVRFLEERPNVAAVTGTIIHFVGNTPFPTPKKEAYDDSYTLKFFPGYYNAELLFDNLFQNIASLYRKNFVIKKHIAYDTTLISAEDYDFWIQFVQHGGTLGSIANTLSYIRHHWSNPSEYYNAMWENSKKIHKKAFSWFFTPSEKEISFSYSLPKRCSILQKIIEGNHQKNIISPYYLESFRRKLSCPNSDNWVFLEHPAWREGVMFEQKQDSMYKRSDTGALYHIVIDGDNLTLTDKNGISETFIATDIKTYSFNPRKKTINLIHPQWKDSFNLNERETAACRTSEKDCALISFQNDKQILIVKWVRWKKETFVFDEERNAYVFKPQI